MGSFSIQRFIFSPQLLLIFLIIFQSLVSQAISWENSKPTAYEILKEFNFPIGILPEGVAGYDLDPSTGKFSAFLNATTCTFTLQRTYKLRYKNTIKGYISNGKLARLEGISVKFLLFWVNVVKVSRNGDELQFSVGIASAGFSVDDFEDGPQCNNQKVRKLIEWCKNPDEYISSLALKMRKKIQEYWDKCNLGLAVAAMLDPRFKMKLLEYYYPRLYGDSASELIDDILEWIKSLYNEHSSVFSL